MNKKGFTLVELLAVLIILSVLMTLVIVSVGKLITNSQNSLSDFQKRQIEDAAKKYYLNEVSDDGNYCVSVSTLLDSGYLEGNKVVDPKDKTELNGYVKITYASNQYTYKYQENSCLSE